MRRFLGYSLKDQTPDHSTISRNRRLIPVETHEEVFVWVLQVLAKEGLVKGKTLAIDATTLEANAALRSIVHRHTGEEYREFLTRLAKESGIETPTRADLARLDKLRKNKGSNKDWEHPHDPDAKIAKMKDGRTHLAHKAEHAVDLESGAVVSVTVQPADRGDTTSIDETINQVMDDLGHAAEDPEANAAIGDHGLSEIVADKGYHSDQVVLDSRQHGIRTYISEPDRGRRRWAGKSQEKAAVYGNRRRNRGRRGRRLRAKRAELNERSFAHCYGRGDLRRMHLRGHGNIIKRMLIHVAGFNLSILLRRVLGAGTPRELGSVSAAFSKLIAAVGRRLKWIALGLWSLTPNFACNDRSSLRAA